MVSTIYSQKAQDYALYRPQYAEEAVSTLIDVTGLNPSWDVADIGSGTGNVARHLVGRVRQVFAIEPNKAMRHQAELLLSPEPSFRSIAATAERTTLPDHCIDLIVIGQAIHWFDRSTVQNEFDRILKFDGWISSIWNRFESDTELNIEFLFSPGTIKRYSFPMAFKETWSQFIGGMRSDANNPNEGQKGYNEFEKQQKKKFDAQAVNGLINVEYTTKLAVGRLNH